MKRKYFVFSFTIIFCIFAINLQYLPSATATVNTNSGSTLQVDFGSSSNLVVTDSSTILTNVGQYISRPSSGWSDTDTVAIEISFTDSSSDTATVSNSGGCTVDLSSSINSGVWGTDSNGSHTLTGASGSIFILNDNSSALNIEGRLDYIIESLAFVKVGCSSQSNLTQKYLRMGAVPTLAATTGTNYFDPLYYLFSTQRYYRYAHYEDASTAAGHADINSLWNYAKSNSAQITVDGTSKSGVTRNGWVATLNTADEVKLTNAINTSGSPMIGTTQKSDTWNWDATAWGGSGSAVATGTQNEYKWLGPDAWGKFIPTMSCQHFCTDNGATSGNFSSTYINANSSRFWKLSNSTWSIAATSAEATIDLAKCSTASPNSDNGYGLYQSWHMEQFSSAGCGSGSGWRPTEPNNSGPYIYQGYNTSGGVAGWDDATYLVAKNMYIEYCSPTYPCPPPAAAAAQIKFRSNQTISITSGPAASSRVNTANTSIAAYATSGFRLTYTIDTSTSSACSIAGAPLTVDSGTSISVSLIQSNTDCTVNINQPGDGNYYAAPQVQLTFTSGFGIVASCTGVGSLLNGSFENFTPNSSETWTAYGGGPKQVLQLNQSRVTGWLTTAGDSKIEIQRQVSGSGQDGTFKTGSYYDTKNIAPAAGSYWAELNANEVATLYQSISTIPGTTIRWSIKHRGRRFSTGSSSNATDRMVVKIGSSIASADTQTASASHGSVRMFSPSGGLWSTTDTPTYPTYSTTPSSTPSLLSSDGYMDDALESGWVLYKGSYVVPAGQTTTLFAFQALSPSTTFGNFLDDIQFSPLVACPASFTVVAGRDATINPFDINNNLNSGGHDSEDSFGWSDATVTETITATGGTLERTTGLNENNNSVSNRAILYHAPTTPGTYTIDYTITNPEGDLSNSRYTVTVVPDSKSRAPSDLPIDPRTTNYNLQLAQVTTATTNVIACVQQSNAAGAVISGSLRFDVGVSGSVDSSISNASGGVTVAADRTNSVQLTGPISAVNSVLTTLRIYRSDTPARLSSVFYLRFSSVVTGLTLYNQSNCGNAQSSQIRVLKVRPISLTQIRSFTAVPKNGRQNN